MANGARSATKGAATRAAILHAAFESFAERGFAGSSLRDIAERTGISHVGLLHHFRGKDELLTALLEQWDADTERKGSPELEDTLSGPDAVMAFLRRAYAERQESPELLLLRAESAVAAVRPDHPAHAYFATRYRRVRDSLAENFRGRLAAGALRPGVDPERAAALWLAVQDGLTLQWLLDPDVDLLGTLEQFVDLLFTEPATGTAEAAGPRLRAVPDAVPQDDVVPSPSPSTPPAGALRALPEPPPRRATIQDVAREAGVSPSAVSKVLRDAYGVSPQMRARVTAAIEALGYRPNAGARGLRGRSYTIGVTITAISSPFQPELVEGMTDRLDQTPFQEVIVNTGVSSEHQRRGVEAMLDRQVDGLILISPVLPQEWLEELGARIPTVVVARHGGSATYDTVHDDEYAGTRLMVDYLVGLGHQRIVHTGQPPFGLERPFVLSHTVRCDGYIRAMERAGLEPDVIVTAYTEQGGYDAAQEALSRPEPPTAIFAGADIAAFGVLRAAEERGLRVPEDLTVVGYDNIYMSTIGRVSLTTIDQSAHLTGAASARLLLERMDGRIEPVHHVVTPTLVARATSGPPRA